LKPTLFLEIRTISWREKKFRFERYENMKEKKNFFHGFLKTSILATCILFQ